ncbi:MAG TPA: hypothetical protein VF478_09285, partial [Anaerolineae bacterium]
MAAAHERLKAESQKMVQAGEAMLLNGQRADAHAAFVQAINLDAQNDAGWVGCARTAESPRAAVDFAKHALQINPGNAEARRLSVEKTDPIESKSK